LQDTERKQLTTAARENQQLAACYNLNHWLVRRNDQKSQKQSIGINPWIIELIPELLN
jgi:hypothetical protein